jgi:hypothetical protein
MGISEKVRHKSKILRLKCIFDLQVLLRRKERVACTAMSGNCYLNAELSGFCWTQAVRAMLIVCGLNVCVAQNAFLGVTLVVVGLFTNGAEEPFNDARHTALARPILVVVQLIARITLVLDHHPFSHDVSPVVIPSSPRKKAAQ